MIRDARVLMLRRVEFTLGIQAVAISGAAPSFCNPTVRAVCSDRANGRKALPYGMRFSCFTHRDLCRR